MPIRLTVGASNFTIKIKVYLFFADKLFKTNPPAVVIFIYREYWRQRKNSGRAKINIAGFSN